MPQQKQFRRKDIYFSTKPKNKWEISLNGGGLFISGDVAFKKSWGAGLEVRKSIGIAVSLKGQCYMVSTKGLAGKEVPDLHNPV